MMNCICSDLQDVLTDLHQAAEERRIPEPQLVARAISATPAGEPRQSLLAVINSAMKTSERRAEAMLAIMEDRALMGGVTGPAYTPESRIEYARPHGPTTFTRPMPANAAERAEWVAEQGRHRGEQAEKDAAIAAALGGARVQAEGPRRRADGRGALILGALENAGSAEYRGLTGTGTTGGGAFTPPEPYSQFWDRLAARTVGLQSGFTTIRTHADSLVIPAVTGDTSAAWIAEAGTISSTDMTAAQIIAVPKKLAALQAATNEALADSNPALLDVIERQLIRSLSCKLDLGFFEGTSTNNEIRGLRNVAGIGGVSLGDNGATPTNLDVFADAIGTLTAADAEATAIVMHPRTWRTLTKIKELTSGSNKPVLMESAGSAGQGIARSIYGVPVFLSSQLNVAETQGTSSAASSAYVYDASQVIAVMREDVRVEIDSSRLFNSDQSEIRAILRADLVVPNPAAIVRISGFIA